MPIIDSIQTQVETIQAKSLDTISTQVHALQTKALDYVKTAQAPVVEYVGKAVGTVAGALPTDRPAIVVRGIDAVAFQAGFAKSILDTEAAFAKAVIDAAVTPFTPAKKRTVKAA